jgi:hypothetical protein
VQPFVDRVGLGAAGAVYRSYLVNSRVRFEGSHPKVVYHKVGGAGSHLLRLANSNDLKASKPAGIPFNPWP